MRNSVAPNTVALSKNIEVASAGFALLHLFSSTRQCQPQEGPKREVRPGVIERKVQGPKQDSTILENKFTQNLSLRPKHLRAYGHKTV